MLPFFPETVLRTIARDPFKPLLLACAMAAGSAWSQPTPAPATPDAACSPEPTAAQQADTVSGPMDRDGYLPLMDGTSFKGWWQSCQTNHSHQSSQGAVFRVDPNQKAFYLTQRGTVGGILMTKKKFDNYELVFDYWTDYGNDGGIFNRTTAKGDCIQTVLDFIVDAAVGGDWSEGTDHPFKAQGGRDFRPWKFSGSIGNITIPGNNAGEQSNWTLFTSKINPTSFGCPATGCTKTEWNALWDMNSWNQMRIQFYGGLTGGASDPMRMKTFFRKVGSPTWVPIMYDTTMVLPIAYPKNYIGLQVHGDGRFGGAKGAWYRNIKWRGLTNKGEYSWPIPPSAAKVPAKANPDSDLRLSGNGLSGHAEENYVIIVTEVSGKEIERFSGRAGRIEHALRSRPRGLLNVRMVTAHGTSVSRLEAGI